MKKGILLIISLCILSSGLYAGEKNSFGTPIGSPYHTTYWIDIPIIAIGLGFSRPVINALRDRDPNMTDTEIEDLSPSDVWWLDRGAAKQNPARANDYLTVSSHLMRGSMFMPAFLLLDRRVRTIWKDYLIMYMEAQSVNAGIYQIGASLFPRKRPFMYNPDESMERKLGDNTTNSFFSGHTSVVATSCFFMVKVYYDLHPGAANRLVWYGLAALPPIAVGYCRYKGGKHFPTDILTGYAVGALSGILIPEWHKKTKGKYVCYPAFPNQKLGFYTRLYF